MLTGELYAHALLPIMVQYSSIGTMKARCPLVRPYLKWLDFTPTRIPVISSSGLLMPYCVISSTIRVI